jgi:hypothetical protein
MPPHVFLDQAVQALAGEDQFIGSEIDHPDPDPEQHGDILGRTAVIADDDVGPFLDEVIGSLDFDLLAKKDEAQPSLETGLDASQGSFEIFHFPLVVWLF